MKFINHYNLGDKYMTNCRATTADIMRRYVTYLLDGHTIKNIPIRTGTIEGYLRAVNDHFDAHDMPMPFSRKHKRQQATQLVVAQEKMQAAPARRQPLNDLMMEKMRHFAQENRFSFRACIWDFTALGKFGGFREQEFAMERPYAIRYYVLPNGDKVVRAFVLRNFLFYADELVRIPVHEALRDRARVQRAGLQYDIQKNRQNGQVIAYVRVASHPAYCPVELGLDICHRAIQLGQGTDDPLCVYRDHHGHKTYLTGTDITKYYRFIAQLVMPSITGAELKLISTHSLRVYACVILSEAGKQGPYIKLRLRWLSNCFEVYLRNTTIIAVQHGEAHSELHERLSQLASETANMVHIVSDEGEYDSDFELDDED